MARDPRLSVILPALDEAARIEDAVRALVQTDGVDEVIVVDGGSRDDTARRAAGVPGVRVLHARRGRGLQLNRGARHARGAVLLFLHVDCRLPVDAAKRIHETVATPGIIAGAFRTRHVLDGLHPRWIRPILPLADLRSRYTRTPYGDQALFVRADVFRSTGGFSDVPLMEDVDLTRRLWRRGRIRVLPDRVEVSARRYAASPLRAAWTMNTYPILWRLGVSEHTLARWYGRPR